MPSNLLLLKTHPAPVSKLSIRDLTPQAPFQRTGPHQASLKQAAEAWSGCLKINMPCFMKVLHV